MKSRFKLKESEVICKVTEYQVEIEIDENDPNFLEEQIRVNDLRNCLYNAQSITDLIEGESTPLVVVNYFISDRGDKVLYYMFDLKTVGG